MPRGRPINDPDKAMAASMATPKKVMRQPKWLPTKAPMGTPMATARLIPPPTMASARPRRSGGTSTPASALALGTSSPAERASKILAPCRNQ